ncbi:MAG: HD domain-containing protein [Lachnospiraceae bacterium]|nr:HD domain-containing protein [Lachnospiraceae bacterium]
MQFVKADSLKIGMRLARPIYNKNGVLLFERDSKLTEQGISSIRNFGLIGIFILEPAEPVPPMTPMDIEFERFQTMYVFNIKEELTKIIQKRKKDRLNFISDNIIKSYGHLQKKINFPQNLRSREDYVYKHSLNVAMLSAMMANVMKLKREDQLTAVYAAICHDMGKLMVPKQIMESPQWDPSDIEANRDYEVGAFQYLDDIFSTEPSVRRACMQAQRLQENFRNGKQGTGAEKLIPQTRILLVADFFDTMTAMNLEKKPESEVKTVRFMLENPDAFDSDAVDALIASINILTPGVSVELNTGEKALVLTENTDNILRPMVLSFADNQIIDLNNELVYGDLEITDIMKTLDNRYIFDPETLRKSGFKMEDE